MSFTKLQNELYGMTEAPGLIEREKHTTTKFRGQGNSGEKNTQTRASKGFGFLGVAAGVFLALAMSTPARAQYLSITNVSNVHAGFAYSVAITQLTTNWAVTAFCNGSGVLELISWESTGSPRQLTREGTKDTRSLCATDASVWGTSVAITAINNSTVVTALADTAGNLELAEWTVTGTTISQYGETYIMPGAATDPSVSITKLDSTRVVTTSFNYGDVPYVIGEAYVVDWQVPSTQMGTFTLLAQSSPATGHGLYSVTTTLPSSQVVTVGSTPAGDLEVTAWNISGNVITKNTPVTAGIFYQTPKMALWTPETIIIGGGLTPIKITPPTVVTAYINASFDAEITSWSVSGDGTITREATGTASGSTPYSPIGLCVVSFGNYPAAIPITAESSSSNPGDLDLQAWGQNGLNDQGPAKANTFDFNYLNTTYTYAPANAAPINSGSSSFAQFVTAGQNASDGTFDLELQEWEVMYVEP